MCCKSNKINMHNYFSYLTFIHKQRDYRFEYRSLKSVNANKYSVNTDLNGRHERQKH